MSRQARRAAERRIQKSGLPAFVIDFLSGRPPVRAAVRQAVFCPDKNDALVQAERDGVVEAVVRPFWSNWSTDFIHGSDAVLATDGLFQHILADRGAIRSIIDLRFSREMCSDLLSFAGIVPDEEGFTRLTRAELGRPCFSLRASTTSGHTVGMVTYPTTAKVARDRSWINDGVGNIVKFVQPRDYELITTSKVRFVFAIPPTTFDSLPDNVHTFAVATAMDVIMSLRQALVMFRCTPDVGSALAVRFQNFIAPPLTFFEQGTGTVEVILDFGSSITTSSAQIYTLEFTFRSSAGGVVGGGTYNYAVRR